jgi:DNA-binding NtrC family response regulator
MAVDEYSEALGSSSPFNVVILDLTIRGGMGGAETFRKLKEIDPDVKAIVASGYSSDPVMVNFSEMGFKGRIIKPHSIEELSLLLQNIIEEINS